MAAHCRECEELVSDQPYEDERMASSCAVCEGPLCEDCSIKLGGICNPCRKVIEEP
jgi:hypothetical protein